MSAIPYGWACRLQSPATPKIEIIGISPDGEDPTAPDFITSPNVLRYATHREAIAFQPQGTTAQRMNLGMWRVWRHEPRAGLLAQGFDSIVFQFRGEGPKVEDEIMQHVLDLIRVELRSPSGRRYVVPGDAKVGWNWGNETSTNPDGLRKWKPGVKDSRTRQRFPGVMWG